MNRFVEIHNDNGRKLRILQIIKINLVFTSKVNIIV